ncbi:MAG: hypothetical protein WC254_01300 [Candidatus Woesearchaeota archaeon]|jgi:hypothetical protein
MNIQRSRRAQLQADDGALRIMDPGSIDDMVFGSVDLVVGSLSEVARMPLYLIPPYIISMGDTVYRESLKESLIEESESSPTFGRYVRHHVKATAYTALSELSTLLVIGILKIVYIPVDLFNS